MLPKPENGRPDDNQHYSKRVCGCVHRRILGTLVRIDGRCPRRGADRFDGFGRIRLWLSRGVFLLVGVI